MFDDLQTTVATVPPNPPAAPVSPPPAPVNPPVVPVSVSPPSPESSVPSPKAVEDIFGSVDKVAPTAPSVSPTVAPAGLPPMASVSAGSNKLILIIVIVVVLILAVGVGGFFAWKAFSGNQTTFPVTTLDQTLPVDNELGKDKGKQLPIEAVEPAPIAVTIDSDSDGLPDSEEITLGTNPNKADTDDDGLFDYDEVKVYKTDPLKPDTDGDGYTDGAEVKSGYNPNGAGKLLDLQSELQKLNTNQPAQ